MAIVTILGSDTIAASRATINDNFAYLAGLFGTLAGSLSGSQALDFPAIPRGESKPLTITAAGAIAGHVALVGPPAGWDDEVSFCAKVSAANTITVIVTNNRADGTEYDPPSGTWSWVAF